MEDWATQVIQDLRYFLVFRSIRTLSQDEGPGILGSVDDLVEHLVLEGGVDFVRQEAKYSRVQSLDW